jgi:protein-tyrosine-phosphatase
MRALFVCVHNAGRSQMAEAFARELSGGQVEAISAGTIPGGTLNPVVVRAMEERGISLAGHEPKVLTQDMADAADRIYTMGCAIDEACPAVFLPSEDWGLDDPAGQPIEVVRRIRDEVERHVRAMLAELDIPARAG